MKRKSSVAVRRMGGTGFVIGSVVIALMGCGQKGPLVHPTSTQSTAAGAASSPAGTGRTQPGN
ncbi:LPS translocon maturation chaperone LptM [Ideonella sp. A 288]|uniref:LPS translocon maturation chaperone LptM n=1 Tax=Ideonella sp. A 288 TaxID=1962181 RepID=UPI001184D685|nr:lipoprotein [Ideonella sp. A 288]